MPLKPQRKVVKKTAVLSDHISVAHVDSDESVDCMSALPPYLRSFGPMIGTAFA